MLNRRHVAVGLDQLPYFVQRCSHPAHKAGPAFADHGQTALQKRRVPLHGPRHARPCEKRHPLNGRRGRIPTFEFTTKLGSKTDVVSGTKRPNAHHVKTVETRGSEHRR